MNTRQAKKVVRNQAIQCRRHYDGPADIRTAGRVNSPESRYCVALRIHLRKLDRETTERAPGAIERCADLYRQMTADRITCLSGIANDWSPGAASVVSSEVSR